MLVDPAEDGDTWLLAVVIAAMMTTTKKARRQPLQWLRQHPASTDPDLGNQVLEALAEQDPRGDSEKEITALRNSWGITAPVPSTPAVELAPAIFTQDRGTGGSERHRRPPARATQRFLGGCEDRPGHRGAGPERDVVVSSLDRPAARELWAGRSQGVPVVEDESQEVWNPFTWGRSTESIVRTRLEIQLRETVVRGAYWPTWDSMTRMVIEVEPTKFAQVAADIIEEAGFDSGCLARWVHWALREDETGRADHSGLESRT